MKNSKLHEWSQQEADEAKNQLQALVDQLNDKVIGLSSEQRKHLSAIGDSRKSFVDKALEYAEEHPEFIPTALNTEEFKVALNAYNHISVLNRTLLQLQRSLEDTILRSGDLAYHTALEVYTMMKWANNKGYKAAGPIYKDLKKLFENQGPSNHIGIDEEGVGKMLDDQESPPGSFNEGEKDDV